MSFFTKKTENIKPYIPGEQPKSKGYIKLNTNENPYPPSRKVIKAIKNMDLKKLRLYPDPESYKLKEVYAKSLGLNIENIFVGNGSDEVLSIAFQTFFADKKDILIPDITYSFYNVYCELYNIKQKDIPLRADYSINIEDYNITNNGIVIANPNAPTGIYLSAKDIEKLTNKNPESIVLIDEAYIAFGGESVTNLIKKYKNLLVVTTLSKSNSLAGLRVGFAIGHKDLISGMNKIKNCINSYPIDRISQICGQEAIKDEKYFNKIINKVCIQREKTKEELIKLGFKCLDSKANFLFAIHNKYKAEDIFLFLNKNKILVRYFKKPRLENGLRITIGKPKEMKKLIKCIEKYIKERESNEKK